jgi:hypothetical protein
MREKMRKKANHYLKRRYGATSTCAWHHLGDPEHRVAQRLVPDRPADLRRRDRHPGVTSMRGL